MWNDRPKVPLEYLFAAAERARNWTSLRTRKEKLIVPETEDQFYEAKINQFATAYQPPRYYGRREKRIFLKFSRSIKDTGEEDITPELQRQRCYSLSFFNVYYGEQEADVDKKIKCLWTKVNGIYQLLWG